MTTIRTFIRTHPLATYFVLTFGISWGGVLLVVAPHGIPGTTEQTDRLFPYVYLAMLAGPSVAGILLTGLVQGRAGLRDLLSRLIRWRVGARWYAVALLAAPLLTLVVLLALSLLSREFLPGILATDDRGSLLVFGIAVGLGAGFFEELGWTGFATPALRRRYGVLATGLILGVLWGAWHFLVNVWGGGNWAGSLSSALFLPSVLTSLAVLPAYRVLMVWVHDRTGSLLVAMLMHASLTTSMVVLQPLAAGMPVVTYVLTFAAALWIVVGVVVSGGQLPRDRVREGVA
jgi:membrane protease YdiL (CAAX protease family)